MCVHSGSLTRAPPQQLLAYQTKCHTDNSLVTVAAPVATAPTGASSLLTWSDASGLSPVTYQVFRQTTDAYGNIVTQSVSGMLAVRSFDLQYVVPAGTTATFYVQTFYKGGSSGLLSSSAPSTTVTYTAPNLALARLPPAQVTAADTGSITILVQGLPADLLNLVVVLTNTATQQVLTFLFTDATPYKTLSNSKMAPNTNYLVQVQCNAASAKLYTALSAPVPASTKPATPTQVTSVTPGTCTSTSCSFTIGVPAVSTGGARPASCILSYGTGLTAGCPCPTPGANAVCNLLSLAPSTSYSVTVAVMDVNGGQSAASNAVQVTTAGVQAQVTSFVANDPTGRNSQWAPGDTMTVAFSASANGQLPYLYGVDLATGLIGAAFTGLNLNQTWASASTAVLYVLGGSAATAPQINRACASALPQKPGTPLTPTCAVLTGTFGSYIPPFVRSTRCRLRPVAERARRSRRRPRRVRRRRPVPQPSPSACTARRSSPSAGSPGCRSSRPSPSSRASCRRRRRRSSPPPARQCRVPCGTPSPRADTEHAPHSNGQLKYGDQQAGASVTLPTVLASKLLSTLKAIKYTGAGRFYGADVITCTVSDGGNQLASVSISANVLFVKSSPSINLTSATTMPSGALTPVPAFTISAPDAENNTVEVTLTASEGPYTAPAGTRLSTLLFASGSADPRLTYTPAFGTEARQVRCRTRAQTRALTRPPLCTPQLVVKGVLPNVLAALRGLSFRTTEYGAVPADALSVRVVDTFSEVPDYQDVAVAAQLIKLTPNCGAVVAPLLASAKFDMVGQALAVLLTFNSTLGVRLSTVLDCAAVVNATGLPLLGAGPTCQVQAYNAIRITLGTKATCAVGNVLGVVANSPELLACPGSSKYALGAAPITAPASVAAPVVQAVLGAASLSIGQTLSLTATGSNGFARPLACIWTATNGLVLVAAPGDSCTVTAAPSATQLTPGSSYTVGVVMSNVFGAVSAERDTVVTVSNYAIPLVYAVGPSSYTITKASPAFRIVVGTDVPFARARFAWRGAGLPASAADGNNFVVVRPSLLSASQSPYSWTCVVSSAPGVNNSATFTVTLAASPLVVGIVGGQQRQVFANSAVTLDGSVSVDPDTGSNAALTFAWSVYDSNGNAAVTPAGAPITLSANPVVTLAAGTLAAGTYSVYLEVSDASTGRDDIAFQSVQIVSQPIPVITITNPPGVVGPAGTVKATALVSVVQSDGTTIPSWQTSCRFAWTYASGAVTGVAVSSGQSVFVTSGDAQYAGLVAFTRCARAHAGPVHRELHLTD